jgi:hypothetical protein
LAWKSAGIVVLNTKRKYKLVAMNDLEASAFEALFREAYQKCFGHPIANPLSETESKLFSNEILDKTGLVIGAKSLKNYSSYVLNTPDSKEENPSVATLDTLARYVINAPYTDEVQRKDKESHFPYWFRYKDQFYRTNHKPNRKKWLFPFTVSFVVLIGLAFIIIVFIFPPKPVFKPITDDFRSVNEDSLAKRGWFVQLKDTVYWKRRGERPGHVTLFTLKGDNWPDSVIVPGIRNLLVRKIRGDCFTAEVRLSDFIPQQNWQQAGILLLEDTGFVGKSIRLSIVYNDFFGGFAKKPEIILQAITFQGKGSKPEEIGNKVLFTLDSTGSDIVINNLKKTAFRIEKQGKKFRFLYTTAPVENYAFKEALSQEFAISPKYIALFALRGPVDNAAAVPAAFSYFSFVPEECVE